MERYKSIGAEAQIEGGEVNQPQVCLTFMPYRYRIMSKLYSFEDNENLLDGALYSKLSN